MANAYKSLGTPTNPGTSLTDLYTVPSSTSAIAFVTVANKSAAALSFRLKHAPAGATDDDDHNLVYDLDVPANNSYIHPVPIYMATTDKLRVYGESTDLTFSASGIEVT